MIAVQKSRNVKKSQKNVIPTSTPSTPEVPKEELKQEQELKQDVPKKLSYRQKQILAIGIDAVRAKEKIARDALKEKKKLTALA